MAQKRKVNKVRHKMLSAEYGIENKIVSLSSVPTYESVSLSRSNLLSHRPFHKFSVPLSRNHRVSLSIELPAMITAKSVPQDGDLVNPFLLGFLSNA